MPPSITVVNGRVLQGALTASLALSGMQTSSQLSRGNQVSEMEPFFMTTHSVSCCILFSNNLNTNPTAFNSLLRRQRTHRKSGDFVCRLGCWAGPA